MADINSLRTCTNLRYFHTWSHTHTNCSKTSRDCVSSTEPQGGYGMSHSFVTGLENSLFTDPISEGSGRNLAQFFHSLGDNNCRQREAAVQTAAQTDPVLSSKSASHCQPATTHHDHNNGAANLSASVESSPERSEKQTGVYRCSEITSFWNNVYIIAQARSFLWHMMTWWYFLFLHLLLHY